jgi:hypothetical protein
MSRRLAALAVLAATLIALGVAGASFAVGPSLPALEGTSIGTAPDAARYSTKLAGATTHVEQLNGGQVTRTLTLDGRWGLQLVTLGGTLTGLSPNGRVLVLSDNVSGGTTLRSRSRFAVVDTRAMRLTQTVALRGDYAVDALSPKGNLLYLIHHLARRGGNGYQVQAYDLRAQRLLPGVIADKRQAGWVMAGWPVARTVTQTGDWVYTLYRQDTNYPFVHALDAAHHTAVCVGLPADWTKDASWISNARLVLDGSRLEVRTSAGMTRFVVDTKTFEVSTP